MPLITQPQLDPSNATDLDLARRRREKSAAALLTLVEVKQTRLSPRESRVLQLIGGDQSMKEIAATLHLSTKTIETHRRAIVTKLDRSGTAALTHYAILHGLVTLN
jgi:DNA-binding NarL/FixJ family response regulator